MTDVASAAVSGSLASGTAAAMSGWPPQEVILWAVIGGLISVWLSSAKVAALTPAWVGGALVQICVAAAAGIALSAGLLAIAPGWAWLAPLAAVPRWVMAGLIAALIFKLGPLAFELGTRWIKGGTSNVQ